MLRTTITLPSTELTSDDAKLIAEYLNATKPFSGGGGWQADVIARDTAFDLKLKAEDFIISHPAPSIYSRLEEREIRAEERKKCTEFFNTHFPDQNHYKHDQGRVYINNVEKLRQLKEEALKWKITAPINTDTTYSSRMFTQSFVNEPIVLRSGPLSGSETPSSNSGCVIL